MVGKHEGLKNEINRGSTEKRQDAILMTSSHRQKCLWFGLLASRNTLGADHLTLEGGGGGG